MMQSAPASYGTLRRLCLPLLTLIALAPAMYAQGLDDGSFANEQARVQWYESQLKAWPAMSPDYEKSGFDPKIWRRPIPPAGVHPRVLMTPQDLPVVRDRMQNSRSGQALWQGFIRNTKHLEDPKHPVGKVYANLVAGKTDKASLAAYEKQRNDLTAPMLWMSYRRLIENDPAKMREHAAAVVSHTQLLQKRFDRLDLSTYGMHQYLQTLPDGIKKHLAGTKDYQGYWMEIANGSPAISYDLMHGAMTDEQRDVMRKFVADTTAGIWTHGMGDPRSGGNWAVCHWVGPLQHMAIEGEKGYDPKVYEVWKTAVERTFTYDRTMAGGSAEPLGKGAFGFWAMPYFARRGVDIAAYPNVIATLHGQLLHSKQPFTDRFKTGGGLGSSLGQPDPWQAIYAKSCFPDDPAVDYVYRAIVGQDYQAFSGNWTYHFASIMYPVFAGAWAIDFDHEKSNDDLLAEIDPPLSWFDPASALLITRSDWTDDAAWMHQRVNTGVSVGHLSSESGTVTFSAHGRVWGEYDNPNNRGPYGGPEHSRNYSTVQIDRRGQSMYPAKFTAYQDKPQATFATTHLTDSWRWEAGIRRPDSKTQNRTDTIADSVPLADFSWAAGFAEPIANMMHWRHVGERMGDRYVNPHLELDYAWRNAGLVRGEQPYLVIQDNVKHGDNKSHLYEWLWQLPWDVTVESLDEQRVIFKEKNGERRLLIAFFTDTPSKKTLMPAVDWYAGSGAPQRSDKIRRSPRLTLRWPYQSQAMHSTAIVMPLAPGDATPQTQWDHERGELSIKTHGQEDHLQISRDANGQPSLTLTRDGSILINTRENKAR